MSSRGPSRAGRGGNASTRFSRAQASAATRASQAQDAEPSVGKSSTSNPVMLLRNCSKLKKKRKKKSLHQAAPRALSLPWLQHIRPAPRAPAPASLPRASPRRLGPRRPPRPQQRLALLEYSRPSFTGNLCGDSGNTGALSSISHLFQGCFCFSRRWRVSKCSFWSLRVRVVTDQPRAAAQHC